MREGRVDHIVELLKFNALWTKNKLHEQKAPIFKNFLGRGPLALLEML